jgi:hypothetical protein
MSGNKMRNRKQAGGHEAEEATAKAVGEKGGGWQLHVTVTKVGTDTQTSE